MNTKTEEKESAKAGNTDATGSNHTKRQATMLANRKLGNIGGWQDRHDSAIAHPSPREAGLVRMIEGWSQRALWHKGEYGSSIGEDYVLGPEWAQIGKGILGLLNGETGRLDCGTLDGFIRDTFTSNGFNDEGDLES